MSQTAQDHSQDADHRSELKRTLKFFSSFAVAFSFISITTGIFSSYGLVLTTSGPAGIWTWPLVAIGHLIVAVIFGELAGKVPLSGYSYQWVSRLVNRGFGWFSGWVGFCYLVLVVPAVDFGLAPIILQLLGVDASKAAINWMVVVAILVLQALINAFGARLATRINNIAVYTEVIGIVGIIIFLGAVVMLSGRANWGMLVSTGNTMSAAHAPYIGSFIMSMVMGSFTLVGFEAAANLSEETINARSNVPKAMIFSVALSSIIGMVFLIVVSVSIKSLPAVTASSSPILLILQNNFGNAIASLFLVLCVVCRFLLRADYHGISFPADLCHVAR
ncbi:amino acid permease [Terrilactibacillus sp. S3-3]|nr:amino acid permease [Terrilactibacillus sp. S3-3]